MLYSLSGTTRIRTIMVWSYCYKKRKQLFARPIIPLLTNSLIQNQIFEYCTKNWAILQQFATSSSSSSLPPG